MTVWKGLRASLRRLLPDQPADLDPRDAYELWADTYDDNAGNAVLLAEANCVRPLIESHQLSGKRVLDAGCGTGRYVQFLLGRHPATLIAFDPSSNMVQKAKEKVQEGEGVFLSIASVESLPFRPSSFDFILCTLVLGHVVRLPASVHQLAATLKRGGFMVISAFHPFAQLLGWKRTFRAGGKPYAAKYYKHLTSDYFSAFASCRLEVKSLLEPVVDESLKTVYDKAGRRDLFEKYFGYPLVTVFELQKR